MVKLHRKMSSSCLGVSHFSSLEEDELCDTLESAFAKCSSAPGAWLVNDVESGTLRHDVTDEVVIQIVNVR